MTPATSGTQHGVEEMDATDSSVGTPGSAKGKRKSNSDGLPLTKSGRVSVSHNEVNEKYDASYRNSDNLIKLLGTHLNLGQACGIIGVALHGAEIPLEDSGSGVTYYLYFAYFAYHAYHAGI